MEESEGRYLQEQSQNQEERRHTDAEILLEAAKKPLFKKLIEDNRMVLDALYPPTIEIPPESRVAAERKLFENALVLAKIDAMTGLHNKVGFEEEVNEAIEQAKRLGTSVALILLDLDGFKLVNDKLGHLAGDKTIIEEAEKIQASIRASDVAGHIGGDEFGVLIRYTGKAAPLIAAERLRQVLPSAGPEEVPVTASLGLAIYQDGDDYTSLYDRADTGLLQTKVHGKDGVGICLADDQVYDIEPFKGDFTQRVGLYNYADGKPENPIGR